MNNKFWNQQGITKDIGGKFITFYPLPIGMLMRLKNTCKEAAPFMAMCFTDTAKDVKVDSTSSVKTEGEGVYPVTNTVTEALSPSLATFRFQQKERGIASLIETLFSEGTKDLLADIIIYSAPETFTKDDKELLLEGTPLPIFIEMGAAILEANKGAFAGLGEHLPRLLSRNGALADGVEAVKGSLGKNQPEK